MIYLDNNASTRMDGQVLAAMTPFFSEFYGNATSNHAFGVNINQQVKEARAKIADLIGADVNEIVFTSGATEAINLALKGCAQQYKGKGNHIITISTEHPAVLDTCKFLEQVGFEVSYLPVNHDGLLDLALLKDAMREETIMVCVMTVNNETGIIQPLKEISEIAHSKNAIFFSDATQAVGKMALNVDDLGIDILCLSAHKFHGPKGVGALFVRSRKPRIKLHALVHGGGHEKGLRSGTLNVPGIVGLGVACEVAAKTMNYNMENVKQLRDHLEKELLKIDNTFLNGNRKQRLENITSISFRGVDADAMIISLKDIAVSNGSACSSTSIEPSHVLKAMGLTDEEAFSTIRFSLSKYNTMAEVELVITEVKKAVHHLRTMVSL